jgi:hypothetical protein
LRPERWNEEGIFLAEKEKNEATIPELKGFTFSLLAFSLLSLVLVSWPRV